MSVMSDLIDEKISVEEAASKALKDGETLAELLEGIVSKQDKIRFSSYHFLLHISEHNPDVLYPRWGYLVDLLKSDNHYNRCIVINLNRANVPQSSTEEWLEGRRTAKRKGNINASPCIKEDRETSMQFAMI
jgi:hypothetical protein